MLPVLVDLPFLKIYTFGVFLALAFFWSTFLIWKNIRLTSYKEDEVFDGLFVSLFGALFLGRLIHVVTHFDKFGFNPLKFLLINGYPGLSMLGIVLGGFLTFYLYTRSKKIKFTEIVDYLIPAIFLALAIGKVGGFFSGAEVGKQTKFFLAIRYVNFDGLRHLTALYEGLMFFLGAYLTYRMIFAIRREKYRKGFTFIFFLWYFSLVYFVFDRLKEFHVYVFGWSLNFVLSGVILLTFTVYFLYYLRYPIFKTIKKLIGSLPYVSKNKR